MVDDELLTIGQVAARTGLNASTLRMWETRYGAPVPRRLPGGHRRYTAHDVEIVHEALRRKGDPAAAIVGDADAVRKLIDLGFAADLEALGIEDAQEVLRRLRRGDRACARARRRGCDRQPII